MDKPWLNADKVFQHLKAQELEELTDEQKAAYKEAETAHLLGKIKSLEDAAEKSDEQVKEINTLKNALLTLQNEELTSMKSEIDNMRKEMRKMRDNGQDVDVSAFKEAVKEFETKTQFIAALSTSEGIEIKADATFADLTHGGQLDQVQPGISDLVKKKPMLFELFRKIPMNTETYTYLQQKDNLVRDAKGVAKCVRGFSSLTKEEIEVVRTNDVKIKDTVDICMDYMDDFDYVERRYEILISDSIAFKVDTEILLGTDTTTSMNSINNVASEFSATNPDAVIGASIEDANMADLVLGMAAQIDTLGRLASFQANVVLVNRMDWFTRIESYKDKEGRYLDPRVSKVNGNYFIGDLMVIPHVDVAANTLYVFDVTKGSILDRRRAALKKSTENGTNFVDEFITLLASVRLQFLVEQNHANAFMKCSDIDVAVGAISLP